MSRIRKLAFPFAIALAICSGQAVKAAEPKLSVKEYRTGAGLSFWYAKLPKASRTAIQVMWPNNLGIVDDGKEGTAALATKLMMFGGAGGKQSRELIAEVKDLDTSARLNAGPFDVRLEMFGPAEDLVEAAGHVNLVVSRPSLDKDWLKRIRNGFTNGIREASLKNLRVARNTANFRLLGKGEYARAMSLSPVSVLSGVTHADIKRWYEGTFSLSAATIVASGNAEPSVVGEAIDKLLAGLPAEERAGQPAQPKSKLNLKPATIVVHKPDAKKAMVVMLGKIPPRTSGQGYKVRYAREMLVGAHARLFKALRSDTGLAYQIGARPIRVGQNSTMLGFMIETTPQTVDKVVGIIRQVYGDFHSKGASASELAATKINIKRDFATVLTKPVHLNAAMVSARESGHSPANFSELPNRLDSLTTDALNSFIKTSMPAAGQFITVIVTPDPSAVAEATCRIEAPEQAVTACH